MEAFDVIDGHIYKHAVKAVLPLLGLLVHVAPARTRRNGHVVSDKDQLKTSQKQTLFWSELRKENPE